MTSALAGSTQWQICDANQTSLCDWHPQNLNSILYGIRQNFSTTNTEIKLCNLQSHQGPHSHLYIQQNKTKDKCYIATHDKSTIKLQNNTNLIKRTRLCRHDVADNVNSDN